MSSREDVHGPDAEGVWQVECEATLFGFDPVAVRASIQPRSRAWRTGGAAARMTGFAVIAPVVAVFPPHAVWLIGALGTGAYLARRRYVERFTLRALSGRCPKCGHELDVRSGRLLAPHPVPCANCHHDSTLRFPEGALEAISAD